MVNDGWKVKHNLNAMNKALMAYQKKFGGDFSLLVRRTSLGIVNEVQVEWPVKTGRSRTGFLPFLWMLGEDAPHKSASGVSPLESAKARREGIRASKYKHKFKGEHIFAYIQNRVTYAPYIEYGVRKGAQKKKSLDVAKLSNVSKQGRGRGYVKRAVEKYHKGMRDELKKIANGESPN